MDSLPSTVKAHDVRIKSLEHRAQNLENEVHDLRALTEAVAVTNNMQQAEDRAGGCLGNKGDECAVTAIKMIDFKRQLKG